jgi:hypothetical protein
MAHSTNNIQTSSDAGMLVRCKMGSAVALVFIKAHNVWTTYQYDVSFRKRLGETHRHPNGSLGTVSTDALEGA